MKKPSTRKYWQRLMEAIATILRTEESEDKTDGYIKTVIQRR